MRSGKLLSVCLLSLFIFSVVTPIALSKADFTVKANDVSIYQNKIFDMNMDKIDDKFMADITINANYYFDVTLCFDHQVTGLDLFKIGRLGAFCYDDTWDLGRRVKAHISREMLDELAGLPGLTMITSAEIRNIFVFIEEQDISAFDVLVDNFDGVTILEALSIAMVPYYAGVENDIASLGNFAEIADVTDIKLNIESVEDINDGTISPNDSTSTAAMNATGMWSAGYTGSGIKVGVCDTGINMDHEQYAGRIGGAQSFVSIAYGYDHDDATVEDVDGHGSHTSGIAVADGTGNAAAIGMAPAAIVYMARVLPSATLYSIAAGCDWLVKTKGCEVINLSFGSDSGDNPGNDLVERTFASLVNSQGVVVCSSAGNEGANGFYTAGTPGTCDDVITVGNIDATGGLPYSMAYSSSRGLNSENHMKPDLCAPGTAILSCGAGSSNSYATYGGTSMASPHVAGAVALLIQAAKAHGIDYNPGTLKSALMQSCTLVDPDMDFLIQGRGYMNVGEAWMIMLRAAKDADDKPVIGALNPLKIPYSFWDPMVQGQTAEIFVSCVTPFTDGELSLEVTGTAAQFITIGEFNNKWTDCVKLTFLIPVNATTGSYAGFVNLRYNGTTILDTAEIDLEIEESNGNRVLNNYRSTYRGDNHIFHGQYLELCDDLRLNGYALSEQNMKMDATLLANYEMVWFPDPYSIWFPNAEKADYSIVRTWNDWTDDEIANLTEFVNNGGTAFFDFLGADEDVGLGLDYGTNVTTINRFTDQFGIHVRDDIWTNPNTIMVGTVGDNPLTKGVSLVDHYGCSLELSGDAVMVTEYAPGSSFATCAYTQTAGGGRVIVLTTNFLLDTEGYQNNYQSGATQNDVFSQNIFRWGAAKNRIERGNVSQVGKDLVVSYKYLKGDDEFFTGSYTGPTNGALVFTETSPDVWTATISSAKSGDYAIFVECGDPGTDEYDYFVFTATGTGGIGLSTGIVVLISSLGLASWYLLSRRKKA
ncbi:MAG: S8 family peptidase [Candidatus Heimdallarchaeota archaeon]